MKETTKETWKFIWNDTKGIIKNAWALYFDILLDTITLGLRKKMK